MDNQNHIRIRVRDDGDRNQERTIDLDSRFQIPVGNTTTGLAVFGLIVHILGWLLLISLAVFLAIQSDNIYPRYDPTFHPLQDPIGDAQPNVEEYQQVRWVGVLLGLPGITFVFLGIAMYTYGRTQRGIDREHTTREVIRID